MASKPPFVSPATDEHWMQLALEEADAAAMHGDVPIGCVLIGSDGKLIAKGQNRRELDHDPTAHAEIVALREAATRTGCWRLEKTTLYVTLEPCVMCTGALINARVDRVVYGALDPKAGAVDSQYSIGQDGRLNHRLNVEGGLLQQESVTRIQRFFSELRAQGKK